MTSIETFRASLDQPTPPASADLALQALWWAGKGEWDRAHGLAQQDEGHPRCDLVHAHLHRVEGDLANARYWYQRAGADLPASSLPDEWDEIATSLLRQ